MHISLFFSKYEFVRELLNYASLGLQATSNVSKQVFDNLQTEVSLLPLTTWLSYHSVNAIKIGGIFLNLNRFKLFHDPLKNFNNVSIALAIASTINSLGFLPRIFILQAGLNSSYLLLAGCMSVKSLADGVKDGHLMLQHSYYAGRRQLQVARALTAVAKIAIGSLFSTHLTTTGRRLLEGLKAFGSYDLTQQYFILKNQALLYVPNKESSCKALIIDGVSSNNPGALGFGDDLTSPLVTEIYKNCDTLTYEAHSIDDLCLSLKKARSEFKQKIDVFTLQAHSSPFGMKLGPDFTLEGSESKLRCLSPYLKPQAQVFAMGCNTATTHQNTSFIQRLSKWVPGREVIGVKAYMNPFFITNYYENGKFHLQSYFPIAYDPNDSLRTFLNPLVSQTKTIVS